MYEKFICILKKTMNQTIFWKLCHKTPHASPVDRPIAATLVLGIGPGRVSPAQAHRASCQTGSRQESLKFFWVVPCQPEV
jgi:hypothetical protein